MKKLLCLLMIATAVIFACCTSSTKINSGKKRSMTYQDNILPTVKANCSPCHIPPNGSKLPLDNFGAVKENISDILRRINMEPGVRGFMPFKHEKLSDSIINIFVKWRDEGLLAK